MIRSDSVAKSIKNTTFCYTLKRRTSNCHHLLYTTLTRVTTTNVSSWVFVCSKGYASSRTCNVAELTRSYDFPSNHWTEASHPSAQNLYVYKSKEPARLRLTRPSGKGAHVQAWVVALSPPTKKSAYMRYSTTVPHVILTCTNH